MKKLALLLLPLISIAVHGQYSANGILAIKEIRNGVVCDSCIITMAGNVSGSAEKVSFLTPNVDNQFLYTDPSLTRELATVNPSKFFVAMGRFSLDFYPYGKVLAHRGEAIPYMDFKDLQFRTAVNGQLRTDWTDIVSLKNDPDFYIGHASADIRHDIRDVETTPAEHYHAGKFDLRLGDSLTVAFRKKKTFAHVYQFSISRVRSVPDYFNFVEFPSDKDFQDILNTEINKVRTEQGPQANHFEIEGGHSALLRFSNNEQYYFFGKIPRNTGVEYAIGKPENWQQLGGEGVKFTQGYSYIYLDSPEPGKTTKVYLRYGRQRESVNAVTIEVKPLPGQPGWIRLAQWVLGVTTLALIAIFIQKQRHKRQIAQLDRKKNEIENQLQLLSGQLNPHFLFNSLNAVQSLIRQNDPEAANQYITEVATFMRTIMDNSRKEFVSLAEEIGIEEKYIALEQKRKAFTYTFRNECGADPSSIDFPPLLLQPIIENSIRHGLAESVPDPALTVAIRCDASDLIVAIIDNGIGYNTSVKAPGHGLSLTIKRIGLINEKLPAMQIIFKTQARPGNGTTTEIRLLKWLS